MMADPNVLSHEDDDAFPRLAPPDPTVERARQQMRESESAVHVHFEDPPKRSARFQFTLPYIFFFNTILAVVLALVQFIAPDLTAALLGLSAFALMVVDAIWGPFEARLQAALHTLLTLYVIVSLIAFAYMI